MSNTVDRMYSTIFSLATCIEHLSFFTWNFFQFNIYDFIAVAYIGVLYYNLLKTLYVLVLDLIPKIGNEVINNFTLVFKATCWPL